LTKIDKVIVMTTVCLALNCLATFIIGKVRDPAWGGGSEEQAGQVNRYVCLFMASCYVLANFLIFVPPWTRAKLALRELADPAEFSKSSNPLHEENEGGLNTAEMNVTPIYPCHVDPMHDYLPMSVLVPGSVDSNAPGAHRKATARTMNPMMTPCTTERGSENKHDTCPTESRSVFT
jgi:hypothetical protein